MKRAPLIAIVVPLIAGILLSEWVHLAAWQLFAATAIILLIAMLLKRFSKAFYVMITASWLMAGMTLCALHNPERHTDYYGHHISTRNRLCIRIEEPVKQTKKVYKLEVEVEQIDAHPARGRLMLFVPLSNVYTPRQGDRLTATARIQEPFTRDSIHDFDYRGYLRHKDILYTAYAPAAQQLSIPQQKSLPQTMRERLIALIQQLKLTPGQQGIAESILLGWKNDLEPQTQAQFRDAGIAHLLCVSGLHVGIVAGILGWLLGWCGNGPIGLKIRGAVQLIGIWAFVLTTGAAPATTRAGVMFTLFVVRRTMLLQGSSLNLLAASALMMLCANPLLAYDVGFQLSYAALLGIIAFHQPLYQLVPWPDRALLDKETDEMMLLQRAKRLLPLRLAQKLMGLLCLTTAATLGTLPLTLLYFHQFPTYFLIANMTIVPCAGLLLAAIMTTLLIPQLAPVLGWLLGITDRLTAWIAQLPYAAIEVHITTPQALLIAAMAAVLWWMLKGRGTTDSSLLDS